MQHGILGSLTKDLNKFGRSVQKELDAAGNMIRSEYNQHNYGPVMVIKIFIRFIISGLISFNGQQQFDNDILANLSFMKSKKYEQAVYLIKIYM